MSKLKEEGLASTTHHDEIDIESQNQIQDHLVLILEIMKTDKRHPRYKELVKRLPLGYQNKYHYVRAHHIFSWFLLLRVYEFVFKNFYLFNFLWGNYRKNTSVTVYANKRRHFGAKKILWKKIVHKLVVTEFVKTCD